MAYTSKLDVARKFRLRKPSPADSPKLDRLRLEAEAFALTILELTPQNADQSAAIRKLHETLQTAIAAIVCAPPIAEPGPNAYLAPGSRDD